MNRVVSVAGPKANRKISLSTRQISVQIGMVFYIRTQIRVSITFYVVSLSFDRVSFSLFLRKDMKCHRSCKNCVNK